MTSATDPLAAPQAGPGAANTSVGGLASEVVRDLSTLVRQEIALAKAELRQEARTAGTAAGAFGGAGFAGYFVLLFLSLALTWGLGAVLPLGWSALIVAVLWAAITGALALVGRQRIRAVRAPERTIETVKEDVRWAKNRNK